MPVFPIPLVPIAGAAVANATLEAGAAAAAVTEVVATAVAAEAAVGAGVALAEAGAAGTAAAAAARTGIGLMEALGLGASVIGLASIPFVVVMTQGERVTMTVSNTTGQQWTVAGMHVHHGKQTAGPKDNVIPAATSTMSDEDKAWLATFGFSKDSGALYGTEGALLLTSGDGKALSVAWYIPIRGSNACNLAFGLTDPEHAWRQLIDQAEPGRTASASDGGYEAKAIISSTSGGDVAMIVQISSSTS